MGFQGTAAEADYFARDPELDYPPPPEEPLTLCQPGGGRRRVQLMPTLLTYLSSRMPSGESLHANSSQRIENQQLVGYTASQVIGELSHRLMTLEANTLLGWPMAGIGNRLRTAPVGGSEVEQVRTAVEKLVQGNLQILTVTPAVLVAAVALSPAGRLLNE